MNVTIDPQAMEAAVNERIGEAVDQALGGWEVKKAIADVITAQVAHGLIAEAIEAAVAKMDKGALATALAHEIERAATAATVGILREGFVDVVCKLRGITDYQTGYAEKRAKITAELTRLTVAHVPQASQTESV